MELLAIALAAYAGVWCAERLTLKDLRTLCLLPLYVWERLRGRA